MLSPLGPRLRDRRKDRQSPKPVPCTTGPAVPPPPPAVGPGPGHPRPRLSFAADECNPWHLWNLYGLGPWTEFDWHALVEAAR